MALYTVGVAGLATGTALKTMLQVATPSTKRARVTKLSVTFDGVVATNTPVEVRLQRQTSAGTGSASIAANFGPNPLDAADPAAGVTAVQGPSGTWTAEPTASSVVETWRVPPTSGLVVQYPLGQEPVMAVSDRIAVVITAAATVNATVNLTWDER